MSTDILTEPFKIGTFVKIRNSGYGVAVIVECRGRLGPKGARVYGVQVAKRRSAYIEVLEEQLEVVVPEPGVTLKIGLPIPKQVSAEK